MRACVRDATMMPAAAAAAVEEVEEEEEVVVVVVGKGVERPFCAIPVVRVQECSAELAAGSPTGFLSLQRQRHKVGLFRLL